MTRKDYILIAEVLRVEYHNAALAEEVEQVGAITAVAYSLCNSLHRDNPRFNGEHFMSVVRGQKELLSRPPRS